MAAATINNLVINDPENVGFKLISQTDYDALVAASATDANIYYFVYPDS